MEWGRNISGNKKCVGGGSEVPRVGERVEKKGDVIHDPDGGRLAVGSSRGLGLSVNVTGMLGKNSPGKQGRSPL